MAALFQVSAHFTIVVDLAVEHDSHAAVVVEGWLVAGDEIDDREPAHAQRHAVINQIAFGVRSAMMHPIAHRAQEFRAAILRRRPGIEIRPTGNSAHEISSICRGRACPCPFACCRPNQMQVIEPPGIWPVFRTPS